MSNSKTKVSSEAALPPELSAAVAEAEAVLKKHDVLATVMTETGSSIPRGLASERELSSRLGAAEITGDGVAELRAQLDAVKERREAAARRRQSASKGLLELEGALTTVRQQVNQGQAAFASGVIQDFQRRWTEACRALAVLRGEAGQLTAALGVPCPTAPPYVASVSAITGAPELRPIAFSETLPRAALPAPVATLAEVRAKLNEHSLIGALKQAVQLDAQHHALSRLRAGQQMEMSGTYTASLPRSRIGLRGRRVGRPHGDARRAALSLLAGPRHTTLGGRGSGGGRIVWHRHRASCGCTESQRQRRSPSPSRSDKPTSPNLHLSNARSAGCRRGHGCVDGLYLQGGQSQKATRSIPA
jgi:hypothetical protein